MTPRFRVAGLLGLIATARAHAEDRYDHRGALGLLIGPGYALKDEVVNSVVEEGFAIPLTLGGTVAVGDNGNEVLVETFTLLGGRHLDLGLAAGYRGYFGDERVKTFITLELAGHLSPQFTVGPRAGLGVQYELSPTVGTFALLAADLGYGAALRFTAEVSVGLQLRTYLLE